MRPHRLLRNLPVLVAGVLLLAGCGGESKSAAGEDAGDAGAGALVHVDGTVTVSDGGFTLEPTKGGDAIEFERGPAIAANEVQAFDAADSVARVTYRLTEDAPIAVAIKAPPAIGEGLETYEGTIEDVSSTRIVIDGADGTRTFTIADADAPAFDQPHLEDHERAGTPVRVFYRDEDAAVAYEDA